MKKQPQEKRQVACSDANLGQTEAKLQRLIKLIDKKRRLPPLAVEERTGNCRGDHLDERDGG
jgi:hypothetical protein